MSKIVKIPFKERFREPMLNETKDLTTRTKKYGEPGDFFEAFGALFTLVKVERKRLSYSAENWRREGCSSFGDFMNLWKELHPVKRIDTEELFWVHQFRKMKSVPEKVLQEYKEKRAEHQKASEELLLVTAVRRGSSHILDKMKINLGEIS